MSASRGNYGALLEQTKPEVIHGDEQNQYFIKTLERLTAQKNASEAEAKLIELLIVLVKRYEDHQHALPNAGPLDIIRHLMEAHNLRQKDLVDVFGTESIVSDVLNGKRELTRDYIKRLSAKFGVSPAAFF